MNKWIVLANVNCRTWWHDNRMLTITLTFNNKLFIFLRWDIFHPKNVPITRFVKVRIEYEVIFCFGYENFCYRKARWRLTKIVFLFSSSFIIVNVKLTCLRCLRHNQLDVCVCAWRFNTLRKLNQTHIQMNREKEKRIENEIVKM